MIVAIIILAIFGLCGGGIALGSKLQYDRIRREKAKTRAQRLHEERTRR